MLERALEKEFDPNRHPHTWARPGVDMDREDYIDLAKVSKQVLGKNPQEVWPNTVEDSPKFCGRHWNRSTPLNTHRSPAYSSKAWPRT